MNTYRIAKYLRISSEDTDFRDESQSIKGQRYFLDDFLKSKAEFQDSLVFEFSDDGYTGTNFDRPGIKNLFQQMKNKEIDCIIVKDISRFGRNYLEVCDYLEQIFPFMGVRFISVNDNYDSNNYSGKTGGLEISIPAFVYSMYSQDISVKIRSGIQTKMQKGEYAGSHTFYGYKKAEGHKNKLVIDEEAAEVVREIFKLSKEGHTVSQIAQILNIKNILSPAAYKQINGCKMTWTIANNEKLWTTNTIKRILKDERYTGKMIYGKYKRVGVGCRKAIQLPKEKWFVVENINPPIISQEDFDLVQHTKPNPVYVPHNTDYPFYKKIRCGHCKRIMQRSRSKNKYFSCKYKTQVVGIPCMDTPVMEKDIYACVLTAIQNHVRLSERLNTAASHFKKNLQKERFEIEGKIKNLEKDIFKANTYRDDVYEQFLDGGMSDENFTNIRSEITEKIKATENEILELKALLQSPCNIDGNFIDTADTFKGIKEITKEVMDALVETVYVYDDNRIEIVWKFKDEFMAMLNLLQEQNGELDEKLYKM